MGALTRSDMRTRWRDRPAAGGFGAVLAAVAVAASWAACGPLAAAGGTNGQAGGPSGGRAAAAPPAERGRTPAPSAAPAEEPAGALALGDAITAALLHNPELAAFSWERRAREARVLQTRLWRNPELRLGVEDIGGSGDRQGFEETETTLMVSRLAELGGKRAKRIRAAEASRSLAGWDYQSKRLGVLAEVAKAFAATLAAQELRALAADLERVAGETVRSVGAHVRSGAALPVELTRARVALGRARVERVRAERHLAAARSALAALWGSRAPAFTHAVGDLDTLLAVPPREAVLGRVERNPDLARWEDEIAERRAAVALAEAERLPNVDVGVGGRHFADNGDAALVVGVTLPLALFDRNQGGIEESRYRLARGRAEREAARVSTHAAVCVAYERLLAAREEAARLRADVLPQAEAVLEGARQAYERGRFRYLDVLDAQRTLFELRAEHIRALLAFHAAAADVERLTASPLGETRAEEDR
jgi:cobalt-zinc-cadmium efflux system outer membrane protein